MATENTARRIAILEEKVESLAQLPVRVAALESQILQLRDDMRDGFSALRGGYEGTMPSLRDEICGGYEGTLLSLRDEIRAGDEETRRYMHMLPRKSFHAWP